MLGKLGDSKGDFASPHLPRPLVEGEPPSPAMEIGKQERPSFSAVVQGKSQVHSLTIEPDRQPNLMTTAQAQINMESALLQPLSQYKGKRAVLFSLSEKSTLVNRLKYVLIGKFSHGRPSWLSIKEFFNGLKLQGSCNVSIYDHKHIFIELSNKTDFDCIWLRLEWCIVGCNMRILKWEPDFCPGIESPIVPVWISMKGIPLYMFEEMPLWQLSNAVGKPIKIDPRNLNRTMLNTARACVEIDITKPLIESFCVCFTEEGTDLVKESFCVEVLYDVLPPYCSGCSHVGHRLEHCKRKQTNGAKAGGNQSTLQGIKLKHAQVWTMVKTKSATTMEKGKETIDIDESVLSRNVEVPDSDSLPNEGAFSPQSAKSGQAFVGVEQIAQEKQHTDLSFDVAKKELIADHAGDFGGRDKAAESILQMVVEHEPKLQKNQKESTDCSMPRSSDMKTADSSQEDSIVLDETPDQVIGDMVASIHLTPSSTQEKFEIQNTKVHMVGAVDDHRDPLVIVEGKRFDVKQSTTRFNVLEGNKAEQIERPVIPTTKDDAVKLQQIARPDSPKVDITESVAAEIDLQQIVDVPNATMVSAQAVHAAGQLAIGGEDAVCAAYAVVASAQDGQIADAASQFVQHQITNLAACESSAHRAGSTSRRRSWADQVEDTGSGQLLEAAENSAQQKQNGDDGQTRFAAATQVVSTPMLSKDHYMALEHTFELHSKREEGVFGNLLCASIPEFYDMSPQEQKDEAAYIMAEFYQYFVHIAIEEEIESASKTAAPDLEHLPTEQEWQTVTSKKKRTTKAKADQKGYQSRQMVDMRIESLRARINKMKRDCPAKRKLLAELEDLNQLHFEDGA